tara:strand:+ start:1965 stop:2315 length:351 start_codon:yes stop_codon:yes gene_type:complete
MISRRQMLALTATAVVGSAIFVSAQGDEAMPGSSSKISQIHNATLRIEYEGVRFLADTILADRDSFPGFPGTVNSDRPKPTAISPLPRLSDGAKSIFANAEFVRERNQAPIRPCVW